MTRAVYIHGTNGAGKTTLARALMVCAQGTTVECTVCDAPCTQIALRGGALPNLLFIGKYRGATGGLDTVQPFANGVKAVVTRAQYHDELFVLESLITPGVDTCKQIAAAVDTVFFLLDTPLEQCIAQMNQRRAARGSEPLEDVSNVESKQRSALGWYRRLTEAGLRTERGTWGYVYNRCKAHLGLSEPSMEALLS